MAIQELRTVAAINRALGAPSIDHVSLVGHGAGIDEQRCWAGPLSIDDLAVSSVAHAVGLIAAFSGVRRGHVPALVTINPMHAAASFRYESFVEPLDWEVPPIWDDLFGDYRCDDGWIRIHTNYPHHRAAALHALGLSSDATRPEFEHALRRRSAIDVEAAIAAAGGVASRQRTRSAWQSAEEGIAVAATPALWENGGTSPEAISAPHRAQESQPKQVAMDMRPTATGPVGSKAPMPAPTGAMPLNGIRVVDLTRVLAGPTATGVLAAWGANVTRIDPPGFEEVPAIVPVTTHGKRCIRIDLATESGRADVLALLAEADVVVHGYRPGSLDALGLGPGPLRRANPQLIEVSLSAFGPGHALSARRGFDSIVQNAVGITDLGAHVAGAAQPTSMPCQALDHAAGWLMAAAVASGLIRRDATGVGGSWSTSLAAVSELLWQSSGSTAEPGRRPSVSEPFGSNVQMHNLDEWLVTVETAWGPLRRLSWPGMIGGQGSSFEAFDPVRS